MIPSRSLIGFGLAVASALVPALARGDSEPSEWPPQSAALVEAWEARKEDVLSLRDMVEKARYVAVISFGDDLDVTGEDLSPVSIETISNADEWIALMKRSDLFGIAHVNGMFAFVVEPPKTADNRTEAINYIYGQPIQAKRCAEEYRDISCGICDVFRDGGWSIRYTWSSGEFEEQYARDSAKAFQEADWKSSVDRLRSKYEESKAACMVNGLKEMGYRNPKDFYSSDR